MKLSTKARYAVLALVDLAMNSKEAAGKLMPISLIGIADRQKLSQQYLEQLFSKLRRANIVKSVRGQYGGYFLAASAADLSISDIIDAVDEPIKSTQCDPTSDLGCQGKHSKCLSHNLWNGMEKTIRNYLDTVTLEDVVEQRPMPLSVMTNAPHNDKTGKLCHVS